MEFCVMKREIDRKCLNHARVHANAQSFDRCESALSLFILVLSARSMHDVAWRGMWICVRSKDAQKQLARTSLIKVAEHSFRARSC